MMGQLQRYNVNESHVQLYVLEQKRAEKTFFYIFQAKDYQPMFGLGKKNKRKEEKISRK